MTNKVIYPFLRCIFCFPILSEHVQFSSLDFFPFIPVVVGSEENKPSRDSVGHRIGLIIFFGIDIFFPTRKICYFCWLKYFLLTWSVAFHNEFAESLEKTAEVGLHMFARQSFT